MGGKVKKSADKIHTSSSVLADEINDMEASYDYIAPYERPIYDLAKTIKPLCAELPKNIKKESDFKRASDIIGEVKTTICMVRAGSSKLTKSKKKDMVKMLDECDESLAEYNRVVHEKYEELGGY